MGVISPVGNDIDTFWNNIISGVNGIGPITRFDTTDYAVKIGAEVKDFDPSQYMEKGDMTLESIRQMFMEDGCQVDELFIVNGITCVSYLSEEEDCCGLVFFHPEGLDYLFMLEAFNYSGNVDTLATVLCSLTPTV